MILAADAVARGGRPSPRRHRCVHLGLNRSVVSSTVSGRGVAEEYEEPSARSMRKQVSALNISGFIWGIADDVLRDVYVRGKYRDVILPMTVIRRLDAVLEPTKQAVLDMKATAGRRGRNEPGRRAPTGVRAGLLQHVALPAPQPDLSRSVSAAAGRLRGVPRRLLAQRPGAPGQVQVPQPDSHAGGGGRPGLPAGEVPGQLDQPQPGARPERGRLRAPGRPGQPQHGHRLRGVDPAL